MAAEDRIHAEFIHRGNALSTEFEDAAALIARAYGQQVETYLQHLLTLIRNTPGNPFTDATVRAGLDQFFSEVEALGIQFYGPGSVFEEQTRVVMNSMARNGMDRLATEGRAQGFVLEQTVLDADAILDAARSGYEVAARNLATVEPLRQLITQELIQGNGTAALTQKLLQAGFITDLQRGNRVYTAEQRARMMARTEPRRLQELAYQDAARTVEPVMNDRLFKWVSVLAPTSTQDSLDRHGHIMSKAEWEVQHWPNDIYVGLPPLRPNDRCSVIFYRRAWLNQEAQDAMAAPPGSEARRIIPSSQKQMLKQLLEGPKLPPVVPPTRPPRPKAPKAPRKPKAGRKVVAPKATTLQEAQDWAMKSGAVKKKADYTGMTVQAANELNTWLADHVINAQMPPLGVVETAKISAGADYLWVIRRMRIGPACWDAERYAKRAADARKGYAIKAKEAAKAAVEYQKKADILREEVKAIEKQIRDAKGADWRAALKADLKTTRMMIRSHERVAEAQRMASKVPCFTQGDSISDVFTHEFGHHIHHLAPADKAMAKRMLDQYTRGDVSLGGLESAFKGYGYGYDRLGGKWTKGKLPTYQNLDPPSTRHTLTKAGQAKAAPISNYATTNTLEHFAEAYADYMKGNRAHIAPEVIEVIEELIANAQQLGKDEWGAK